MSDKPPPAKKAKSEYFATQPAPHHNGSYHKTIWYAPNKFEAYGQEEIDAVTECLKDGWLAPGPRTAKFEKEVSAYFGKECGIFVNSGSSALTLALHMMGCKPGDEIITPACTFSTTVAPLCQMQLTPVFVDVEWDTFVPSVEQAMAAVTPKTKCMNLPNLAGSKPDWAELKKRLAAIGRSDVWLLEDSCDTMTYTPSTDIAVISFYASHVITAGGGGGMVMCNDPAIREVGLQYRDWGRIGNNVEDPSERFNYQVDGIPYDFKFLYGVQGYNFKSTEMNAAFGLVQMKKLPEFVKHRRRNCERYRAGLEGSEILLPRDDPDFNWLAQPFLVPPHWDRKELLHHIENNGIQTRVFFAGNITRHPAYRMFFDEKNPDKFPNSDRIMKDCFLLGAHHGLSDEDIDYVVSVLKDFKPRSGAADPTKLIPDANCDL